jgi:hypothetical protein
MNGADFVNISKNGLTLHDHIKTESISWNESGLGLNGDTAFQAKRVSWVKI